MRQNIVVTMAGRGSRFYEAGYTVPKYEIEVHGRSLFDWSMRSLENLISSDSRLIFVCLAENHSAPYVQMRCESLGFKDFHIIEVPEVTDGQATSAYVSRHLWLADAPLLIYNIDTYVRPEALHMEMIRSGSDGWAPCFQVPGEHWSFIRIGADGWADKAAEKERISDYASIGLYWFGSAAAYVQAYDEFFSDPANLVKGERYVAPIYRHLIEQGRKISVSDLPLIDVHVLGTPAELDVFAAQHLENIL